MARTARQYASDINQTAITAADGVLGDGAGNEYRHSQSFTLTIATRIGSISWNVSSISGAPTGTVSVRIETNTGAGSASGVLVHPNAITTGTTPSTGWNVVPFTPFTLPAGTYWIVFGCDNQANNVGWWYNRAGNVLAGNEVKYNLNGGAWTAAGGNDITFKVTQAGAPTRTTAGARLGMMAGRNGGFEVGTGSNVTVTNQWLGNIAYKIYNSIMNFGGVTNDTSFSTEDSHSGSQSLKISATIGTSESVGIRNYLNNTIGATDTPYLIPIKPSTSYTFSFWIKKISGAGIIYYNPKTLTAAYGGTDHQLDATEVTNEWTKITQTITSGASDVWLAWYINSFNASKVCYIDDISLQQVSRSPVV